MDGLTGSEIAGFVVGGLLLGATITAPKVDGFIASSQRRSLGMCKRCGDLRIVACSQCKGMGSVRKGGLLNLGMLDDLYESLRAETKNENFIPCTNCRSKGRLLCPKCSKVLLQCYLSVGVPGRKEQLTENHRFSITESDTGSEGQACVAEHCSCWRHCWLIT